MNQGQSAQNIQIDELSITANQSYQDMVDKKIKWKTVDDGYLSTESEEDIAGKSSFVQQRIRVFEATFTPADAHFHTNIIM